MKKLNYSFICVLFVLSCNNKINTVYDISLPDAEELTSSSKIISADLLSPIDIIIKNNKLIILEMISKDMFKVFDVSSLKYLYSFGERGQGPNDFLSNGINIIHNENDCVEIHDIDNVKFLRFLDTIAFIEKKLPISRINLRNPINGLGKLNDSIYFFDNIFEGDRKKEFTRQNIKTNKRYYFSILPNWYKNETIINEMQKYSIYKASKKVLPPKKRIVVFYYRFPAMKIIDYDGNVCKEIKIRIQNQNFNAYDANTTYFTSQSFLTNDYIYALYLGKPNDVIIAEEDSFRPDLLIFNWEGSIVGRYVLDKPITAFTISEETGKIYGVSSLGDSHINSIYEFELPRINNEKYP